MKLLSTYYSEDESRKAEVFFVNQNNFNVVVKSDTGTHYSIGFEDENSAENYAESWVL